MIDTAVFIPSTDSLKRTSVNKRVPCPFLHYLSTIKNSDELDLQLSLQRSEPTQKQEQSVTGILRTLLSKAKS